MLSRCRLSLLACVLAFTIVTGETCVSNMTALNLQPNFDLKQYLGTWYEIKAWFHAGVNQQTLWDDMYYTYRATADPDTADAFYVGRNSSASCVTWGGHELAKSSNDEFPGRLTLRIRGMNTGNMADKAYYVLATDYSGYALVVECTNGASLTDGICQPNANVVVLSRTRTLPDSLNDLVDARINEDLCYVKLADFRLDTQDGEACAEPAITAAGSGLDWSKITLVSFFIAGLQIAWS